MEYTYSGSTNSTMRESGYKEGNKKTSFLASDIRINREKNRTRMMKNKNKILIVEDNMLNQMLAGMILSGWGFEFDVCANGKLAVEMLRQNVYNLILMDIQMPEMDGYETTGFIHEKLLLNIPIIAMTAHTMPGERDRCLSFGMTDYISKPLIETELFNLVTKYNK